MQFTIKKTIITLLSIILGTLLLPTIKNSPTILNFNPKSVRQVKPAELAYTEFETVNYYIKPPIGSAYNYAYANCTFGVASWTKVPFGMGNAADWDDNARLMGYKVSPTPGVGSIAVDNSGYYGHVALVLGLDGDSIYIKEENYDWAGSIRERWASSAEFQSYIWF